MMSRSPGWLINFSPLPPSHAVGQLAAVGSSSAEITGKEFTKEINSLMYRTRGQGQDQLEQDVQNL